MRQRGFHPVYLLLTHNIINFFGLISLWRKVHFAVQSLDILGFWDDETLIQRYRVRVDRIVQWVLSMQLAPNNNNDEMDNENHEELDNT